MKKYIGAILSFTSVVMLFYIIQNQHEQIHELKSTISKVDSLQYVIDSVSNEEFISRTAYDRYEIALDKLKEENPQAAEQFEECLKNTE